MSETEVVNLTINATEVRSINEVSTIITNEIQEFADRHGVGEQHNKEQTDRDVSHLLVKRDIVDLRTLEVHILEDGKIGVGSFSGRRLATLRFNIRYVGRGYRR